VRPYVVGPLFSFFFFFPPPSPGRLAKKIGFFSFFFLLLLCPEFGAARGRKPARAGEEIPFPSLLLDPGVRGSKLQFHPPGCAGFLFSPPSSFFFFHRNLLGGMSATDSSPFSRVGWVGGGQTSRKERDYFFPGTGAELPEEPFFFPFPPRPSVQEGFRYLSLFPNPLPGHRRGKGEGKGKGLFLFSFFFPSACSSGSIKVRRKEGKGRGVFFFFFFFFCWQVILPCQSLENKAGVSSFPLFPSPCPFGRPMARNGRSSENRGRFFFLFFFWFRLMPGDNKRFFFPFGWYANKRGSP